RWKKVCASRFVKVAVLLVLASLPKSFSNSVNNGKGSMALCDLLLLKASSSIGRAPVSKTGCWGFESLLACHLSVLKLKVSTAYEYKKRRKRISPGSP